MSDIGPALRKLLDIDFESDEEVASMVATALLEIERLPYSFSINHNIGAPLFVACPLPYAFAYGKTVGICTQDRAVAFKWINDAILKGYAVTRAGYHTPGIKDREGYGPAYTIERCRERAQFHRRPADDDDIPF